MTDPRKHSTPLVDSEKEPDGLPFHITDWMPFREALYHVAQVVGSPARAAEELRRGIASGVIEAIDLRVFRWGNRAQYNLSGPEQSGIEVGPLPLSPVHKAHWGRVIRKALANENRLITPGEEDLEDLADEFVRLETSNGVTLDEEDFKARADFWGRLIRIARANEHGVLLTPGGQEIFIIRPVPYLCRADVERTWPTELPSKRPESAAAGGEPRANVNLQRKLPAKRPKGVGVKLWRVICIVLDLRRGGHRDSKQPVLLEEVNKVLAIESASLAKIETTSLATVKNAIAWLRNEDLIDH
jgi:hypothetical protein